MLHKLNQKKQKKKQTISDAKPSDFEEISETVQEILNDFKT